MQNQEGVETMQATREGSATHNAVRIMSALALATLLGVGCGRTEKPEPAAPAAAEAPKAVEAEKWEPETVQPPKVQSDHGHDGHDHGPGGHSH